jgi:prolipoprotein diacylglyceryltransferase
MNKYVKYGIVTSAIIVAVLLATKKAKTIETNEDKDFNDLINRIENAKK